MMSRGSEQLYVLSAYFFPVGCNPMVGGLRLDLFM